MFLLVFATRAISAATSIRIFKSELTMDTSTEAISLAVRSSSSSFSGGGEFILFALCIFLKNIKIGDKIDV